MSKEGTLGRSGQCPTSPVAPQRQARTGPLHSFQCPPSGCTEGTCAPDKAVWLAGFPLQCPGWPSGCLSSPTLQVGKLRPGGGAEVPGVTGRVRGRAGGGRGISAPLSLGCRKNSSSLPSCGQSHTSTACLHEVGDAS